MIIQERSKSGVVGNCEVFRLLVEHSPDLVTITDLERTIRYVNPSIVSTLGFQPQEVIGRDALELVHPEDVPLIRSAIARGLEQPHVPQHVEHRLGHKDGTWRSFESVGKYIPNVGNPCLVMSSRDVTERQRIEGALQETQRAHTTLLKDLPGMAYRCGNDPQWTMELVSERCLELTGYPPSDIVANRRVAYGDIVHSGDRDTVWNDVQRAVRKKRPFELFYRICTARGEEKWVWDKGRGVYGPDGTLLALEGFIIDITERKRAEETLRESEAKFRTLADQSPNMIFINKGGRVVYANAKCEEVMGYTREELCAPTFDFRALIAPESRPLVEENLRRHMQGEDIPPYEYSILTRSGGSVEGIHTTRLIEYEGGRAILGIVTDVTERNRTKRALEESERKFRSVVQSASDAIVVVGPEGRIESWNEGAESIFGYSQQEALRREIGALLPRHTLGNSGQAPFPRAPRAVETLGLHKDGTEFPVELSSASWSTTQGSFRSFILRDITQRKEIEEALRRSEEKYRALVDNALVGVYRTTLGGRILYANEALAEALGYDSPEELTTVDIRSRYRNPEVRTAFLEELKSQGKVGNKEIEMLTRTGEVRTVLVSAVLEGDTLSGMVRDITMRKRAEEERERLQAQLVEAQKMEAVGRLAGGVAHDFNNLLTVINGYSEMALEQVSSEDARKDIEEVRRAGARAATLTKQLLAFSRRQVLQAQVLDLNVVLSHLEGMLHRLIGENIQVVTSFGEGLWRVQADPGQIDQVLLNLAINARDAMPAGGQLTLETRNVVIDEKFGRQHPQAELRPGPYVQLSVRDTGCGMDEETRSHVFEPFFTTKEKGKGTGLGLATAYGIIKQSGGHIRVESAPRAGTTFLIYLPGHDGEARPAR